MAKRFGINVKAVRALLNVGLLCVQQKRFEHAEQIFRALKAHCTGLPQPGVFLGLSCFTRGHLAGAQQELEASVAAYPADQLGKALLAVVYREKGRSDWRGMLREVIEDGRDAAAIRFARIELDVHGAAAEASGHRVLHEQRVYG
jgi:uncharacterized protein HemY